MGQPFEATVSVRADAAEDLSPSCISAEVFYGDSRQATSAVTTELTRGDGAEAQVLVRCALPIDEPVVSVYVTLGCTTRVMRKWMSFADPPGARADAALAGAQALPAAPLTVPAESLAAPRMAAAPASAARAQRRAAAPRPRAVAALAPKAVPASRLRVDVIDTQADRQTATQALPRSSLRLSGDLPAAPVDDSGAQRAAAAALWKALNTSPEELQRDHQRVQELEAGFERLRAEVERSQQAIAKLEARALQAPAPSPVTAWVAVLGVLAALLAAAVAWLAWQRWRDHLYAADWHDAPPAEGHSTLDTTAPSVLPRMLPADPLPQQAVSEKVPGPASAPVTLPDDGDEPATAGTPHVFDERPRLPPVARSAARAEPSEGAPAAARPRERGPRPMSVEELIDLEQQSDFFVVLGQDEAAIDLLLAHVRDPGASSPLPYLKLLEIYQRRSEHIEYERVRKHYNQHFNAMAPAWDADLDDGPRLEDYPPVIQRLQRAWSTPAQALEALRASLVEWDPVAQPLALPAYRELLLLYSMARDLTERDEGGVDVLLPLDDSAAPGTPPGRPVGGEAGDAKARRREPAVEAASSSGDALSFEAAGVPLHRP